MRLYVQRPWVQIHSNYSSVGIMRAYLSGARIEVEIWADGHNEEGIDAWMENGMTADLTLEQAKKLHKMLGEAISKAESVTITTENNEKEMKEMENESKQARENTEGSA